MPGQKEGEKVRFVGKHSKDTNLSIYLQKRNIFEMETPDNGPVCEQLGCIVRVKGERLGTDKAVVVGVLARVICDFGLQYTEHVLYQLEAQLHPRLEAGLQSQPSSVGGVFDFETRFVTSLPDNWHIPFLVRLPKGLPPSVYLRNAGIGGAHWGLTYYIFAYITNEKAARSTLERHGVEGAWPRMRLGRRHSKVFLSFSKTNVALSERICRSLPPSTGMNKRKSFLSSGSPLLLEAFLDKAAYYAGEPIRVTLRIRNAGKQRVTGIRITLKQLLTVKYGNEPRQVIKATIGEYEGHDVQLREAMQYEATLSIDTKFNQQRSAYQIALESQFPTVPENPKILAATCAFCGPSFNGIPWGIERLKIFNLEYYVNVHAVIPWASNLIVKLPFIMVSTGGEMRTFDGQAVPPLQSSTEELSLGGRLSKPSSVRPSATPLKGNLISFDLEDDGENGADDLDVDQSNCGNQAAEDIAPSMAVDSRHPVDNLFPTGAAPSSLASTNREGVRWREDIAAARSILESSQTAINNLHKKLLADKLDRRSLALQHSTRRTVMNRTFLEQLNGLITQDMVNLRSSVVLARQGEQSCNLLKFSAAQAIAFRLNGLGVAHAELVPLGVAKDQVEEHLEAFARIMDDFELFLVRAARATAGGDDAAQVLDRISLRSSRLIYDLPGYSSIERCLKSLMKTISLRGWAVMKHQQQQVRAPDDDSDEEGSEEEELDDGTLGGTAEERLATMAIQFQSLYNSQIATDDGEGDYDAFPGQLVDYGRNLRSLLASDFCSSNALSVAAYFNWRFFFAIAEHFYSGSNSMSNLLLFSGIRDCLRWSRQVESLVPARFLLVGGSHKSGWTEGGELENVANQIVVAMQGLI